MFNKGVNIEIIKEVNPVVNSAKGSLLMLKYAGVPEAEELFNRFRFIKELINKKNTTQHLLTKSFAIIQEIRYKTINAYIDKYVFDTVVDLGCGYSPRGLLFKDSKVKYIGIDLPSILDDLRIAGNDINYFSADITNLSFLLPAFEQIEGKTLIITEGVLSYFTESELEVVIENIKYLLQKYNATWITPDFYNNDYVYSVMKPIFKDEYEEIKNMISSLKRTNVGTEIRESEIPVITKGLDLLKKFNLKAEKIDFIPSNLKLPYLQSLPEKISNEIRNNYKNFSHLYITADGKKSEINFSKEFSFTISRSECEYVIHLVGRLDTISSPELLSFYKFTLKRKNVDKIIIDCKKLEYISSAGLRVLLIIYKDSLCKLKVINLNTIVSEIFEQTGFKDFLCK